MEDYYCYHFPTSSEKTAELNTSFPVVHSSSHNRNRSSPSPRPYRAHDDAGELRPHYLDACFRCARILPGNRDIFMYRGDTPFCSEECRQEQIDSDEAAEKRSKQSGATREQQRQQENTHRLPVWAGRSIDRSNGLNARY